MLWAEYGRMEAASRASARFEVEVHDKYVAARVAEGYDEADAGKIGKIFDARDFSDSFRKFLRLRLDRRMTKLLGLEDYEKEIMRERIKAVMAPPAPAPGAKPTVKQIQIGDAEIQQQQYMKALASRRQRRGP